MNKNKLMKQDLTERLNSLSGNYNIDDEVNIIIESLNHFIPNRDWIEKMNRNDIAYLITNSKDRQSLIESISNKFFSEKGKAVLNEGIFNDGIQKIYTTEELRNLEREFYDYLKKHDVYPEDGTFSNSDSSLYDLDLELLIEGDWKHDHLYTEHLIDDFCEQKGLGVIRHDVEEVGESDSDWYKAWHYWKIDTVKKDSEERINFFRNFFDESLKEDTAELEEGKTIFKKVDLNIPERWVVVRYNNKYALMTKNEFEKAKEDPVAWFKEMSIDLFPSVKELVNTFKREAAYNHIFKNVESDEELTEEYGYYKDEEFCGEIADALEDGNDNGYVYVPYSDEAVDWDLDIQGIDNFYCDGFYEFLLRDISYPVRDGHLDYYGLDEFISRDFVEELDFEELKKDFDNLGYGEDFEEWFNSDEDEFEFWIDYEIIFDVDEYERLRDLAFEKDEEDEENDEDINYDRRAVEKEYGLEDGELDGVSIRDAEELVGEEEGALDSFIIEEESLNEARPRTRKEYRVLQGNYGYGWDDLVSYEITGDIEKDKETYKEIRQDRKDYDANEPYPHRVITRFEKKEIKEESLKEDESNKTIVDFNYDVSSKDIPDSDWQNWVEFELEDGTTKRGIHNIKKSNLSFKDYGQAIKQVLNQKYGYNVNFRNILTDEEVEKSSIDFDEKNLKEDNTSTDMKSRLDAFVKGSIKESMETEVNSWWEEVEKSNKDNNWGFNIDNTDSTVAEKHMAMFDMIGSLKDKDDDLFKKGKSIYNKYAKYSRYNESLKEDKKEPKLDTFEEKIDFLAADEQEAIDGYDKILAMLGEEDANVKEQLTKIRIEEQAHKDFLEKVKTDKSAIYTEPLEQEEDEEVEDEVVEDEVVEESLKESTDNLCTLYVVRDTENGKVGQYVEYDCEEIDEEDFIEQLSEIKDVVGIYGSCTNTGPIDPKWEKETVTECNNKDNKGDK